MCVGTGGHVLPVKNIINELINYGIEEKNIIVITDKRGNEFLKLEKIEVEIKEFFITNKGVKGYLKNITKLLASVIEIRKFLKDKSVKIIFTTGAYIAPIAAIVSKLIRSKFYIQEQNIYAGYGNKVSAHFASKIFTSFKDTKNIKVKNIMFAGPIVNTNLNSQDLLIKSIKTISFIGGSQGSKDINKLALDFLNHPISKNFKVLHITGKGNMNLEIKNENYIQYEYVEDMDNIYKITDLVIGRSGGGSLEPAFLGIPQLLIPYKHGTTSDHQRLNAEFLEKKGLGIIVHSFSDMLDCIIKLSDNLNEHFRNDQVLQKGNKIVSKEIYDQFFR